MKGIAWTVFLTFIGISATANYLHGEDQLGGALMAVIPVGFAATIFLVEVMVSRGKRSGLLFIAASVVGGGAGVASYVGLYTMAIDHGVPQVVALLLPLAYDGVVAVASLAIRGLGSERVNTLSSDKVFNAEMNTPVNTEPKIQMNTLNAEPMNTLNAAVNTEPMNTLNADVHPVQSANEHLNASAVNTEPNSPVNTEPKAQMNTLNAAVNTEPMNTLNAAVNMAKSEPVNTEMNTPVNTDREAEMNTVRELLAEGLSVRAIASKMNISTGKASGLKKAVEAESLDAELEKILADNGQA